MLVCSAPVLYCSACLHRRPRPRVRTRLASEDIGATAHDMTCDIAGRYDEMGTVLRRITNAPVNLPPELLAEHRPVTRKDPSSNFTVRWQSWRLRFDVRRYRSVSSRSSPPDTGEDQDSATGCAVEDNIDACSSDGGGKEADLCAGMRRVLCPKHDARLRRSTIVLIVVWFTLSYGSYGVATWNNQLFTDVGLSNPYLCSFIYSISTLPGNIGSIFLVEKVRKQR